MFSVFGPVITRRFILSMVAGAIMSSSPVAALAQESWPSAPVRFVVPVTPGSVLDIIARLVAPELSKRLETEIVIENRPGANHAIGLASVGRSKPDGHTWVIASIPMTTNAALTKVPYDPIEDFEPVAMVGRVANVAVVPKQLQVNTLKEFVEKAKSEPLKYANAANGSIVHINTQLLSRIADFSITSVPYQGQAAAISDLLSDRVQFTMSTPIVVDPYVKSGELVALAVASKTRSSLLPDVPTFEEEGYSDVTVDSWSGILVPAGTPADIVERINKEVNDMLADQSFRAELERIGITPETGTNTSDEFAKLISDEVKSWPSKFEEIGIKGD